MSPHTSAWFTSLASSLGHPGYVTLTEVVEAFPGAIESVSVSKPSLEDVFIQRTGHRFWLDKNEEQS